MRNSSWTWLEVHFIKRFSCPKGKFLTCGTNLSSCTVHSFRYFWKWSGSLWEFGMALIFPYSPRLHLVLDPMLRRYCTVLISGSYNKHICPGKALLCLGPHSLLHTCLLQSHPVLFQGKLLSSKILGYYQQFLSFIIKLFRWIHSHPPLYCCSRHTH